VTQRTVGIIVALSAEARAVAGRTLPICTPVPLANEVVLWVGGIGSEAARRGCQALVDAGVGALASVGTAAGLAPDCAPGTLVLPHEVLCSGQPPIPVDVAWRRALSSALEGKLTVAPGAVAGTDTVLGSPEKQALYQQTGAVSADMESTAVAMTSARLDVPLMVVRAVSDGSEDVVPTGVLNAVDAYGRPSYWRVAALLAKHPADATAILRLTAGFRAACRTLRLVVRCAGLRFRCPS